MQVVFSLHTSSVEQHREWFARICGVCRMGRIENEREWKRNAGKIGKQTKAKCVSHWHMSPLSSHNVVRRMHASQTKCLRVFACDAVPKYGMCMYERDDNEILFWRIFSFSACEILYGHKGLSAAGEWESMLAYKQYKEMGGKEQVDFLQFLPDRWVVIDRTNE